MKALIYKRWWRGAGSSKTTEIYIPKQGIVLRQPSISTKFKCSSYDKLPAGGIWGTTFIAEIELAEDFIERIQACLEESNNLAAMLSGFFDSLKVIYPEE